MAIIANGVLGILIVVIDASVENAHTLNNTPR